MVGGIGAGFNSTSTMSLLVSYSKKTEREQNIGLIEMAGGIGLLGGPLFGATMFSLSGYSGPFASMAIIYIVMLPIVFSALKVASAEREALS